jgi:trafficking protein particle complex subunit 11
VPALLLGFFHISASDPQEADDQLKTDINAIRTALSRSGFKTRFAAVLLSDKSILHAPQLDERLSSIRRLTSLDSKTGLFFMPPMSSQGEIGTFVHSVITTLQPMCVEYYRDLTKHARRKKSKNTGAAPTVTLPSGATVQCLALFGWSIRYEIKQGVFAEMRQEMEIAERHYSTAIDELFAPDGIFETTEVLSPRWNELRLLCDSLAIRVIRCLLWTAQTTAAVQIWKTYKQRMKALIEKHGKGSETYSWIAWEARWAEIMAQLVQRAEPSALQQPNPKPAEEPAEAVAMNIYAAPEKAFAAVERLPPFSSLHHAGYWLRLALQGIRTRWTKALEVPDEAVAPPDQSPASTLANFSGSQDSYLVPELYKEIKLAKGEADTSSELTHSAMMQGLATNAVGQFASRTQIRMADFIKLEVARDLLRTERYQEAAQILRPLWEDTSWRIEEWHDVFTNLLLALRQCAQELEDRETVLTTTYEVMSLPEANSEEHLSLDSCLSEVGSKDERLDLHLDGTARLCPVNMSFGFCDRETYVGSALQCQLEIISHANSSSGQLTLSSVRVRIGSSKTVLINHTDVATQDFAELAPLTASSNDAFQGQANLTFSPGQRRILSFHLPFRESAVYRLKSISTCIESTDFRIEHTLHEDTISKANILFTRSETGALEELPASHLDTKAVTVLPKPPKVRVLVHGHEKEYYTDELIKLSLELKNEEIEAVEGNVSARVSGDTKESLPLRWANDTEDEVAGDDAESTQQSTTLKSVPSIASGGSRHIVLYAKAPSEALEAGVLVDLEYTLVSDKTTTLRKGVTILINVVLLFEAKFSFGPLLYPGTWPSYFDPELGIVNEKPSGIPQRWRLGSLLRSLASSNLVLHAVKPVIEDVIGDSFANVEDVEALNNLPVAPGTVERFTFEMLTRKDSLDDRRPTAVDSTLAITWSRDNKDSEHTTTHVSVPRLTLPVSEPRVLCTLGDIGSDSEHDAILQYVIENPSTHFLTFAVTMEPTEEFAFSGPKHRTLSLAPLSRYKLEYRIMLQEPDDVQQNMKDSADGEGRWIWPSLLVVDSYYQKTLRVHPGGVDVRFDEKQNIGVFIRHR